MVFVFVLSACFDDDSSLGTRYISDIEIEELEDATMVSFMGNVLTRTPEVQTDYDEASLSYAWYLIDNSENTEEDGYRYNKYRDD